MQITYVILNVAKRSEESQQSHPIKSIGMLRFTQHDTFTAILW